MAKLIKNHDIECDFCQKYYKISTLAEMWDMSQKTVRRMIATGQLEKVRIAGRIRIPHSEIVRAMRV